MGATSLEEISNQHKEACDLIHTMKVEERIDNGEIPLSQKQVPTDSPSSKNDDIICISSRGTVDVTKLKSLLQEGYNTKEEDKDISSIPTGKKTDSYSNTNLWDNSNASTNNVSITRPSHDSWGIKKIILLFCDDFCSRIYELPWWHSRSDIRDAIEPIFDVLGITDNKNRVIVRLLLASLPPRVTIPVHHDTGEWVRQTHRVHVPVLVREPENVLFRCGLSEDKMKRVDCNEGHVFEMNNQAKHAVSNCSNDYRVHLILDYIDVDDDSENNNRKRILLTAGERLLQTRRSIDRWVDRNTRPTPSFLILGAQKAGTTSLYEYMVQHPLIVRAKRRETHCLDWRWLYNNKDNNDKKNNKKKNNKTLSLLEKQRQHCLEFYYAKELKNYPSCLTGDSTPSYLLDSYRVITHIKRVFPHLSTFFVMLRNPVQRALSHYAMVTSKDGTEAQKITRGTQWSNLTFEEVVQQELYDLQHKYKLVPYWKQKDEGEYYIDQTVFDAFHGSTEEEEAWAKFQKHGIPLHTGSHSLLARGLYDLQLRRKWFESFSQKSFVILILEDGFTMEKVWKHLDLPPYTIPDTEPKNTRQYDDSNKDNSKIHTLLQTFYEPHNTKLSQLLNNKQLPW